MTILITYLVATLGAFIGACLADLGLRQGEVPVIEWSVNFKLATIVAVFWVITAEVSNYV